MTATRIPSEAELIELEQAVLLPLELEAQHSDEYGRDDRLIGTIRALLDLARTVQNP